MVPNTHYSKNKNASDAKMLTTKKITTALMLLGLLSLGTALIATQLHAAEANVAGVNLYAKNYKEQNGYHLKSQEANPETKIFVSNHKDDDNISMLEKGYDMMGSSGFDGTTAPADWALQHGKNIKADTVLIYSKYGSTKTPHGKLELIKEAAKSGGEIDAKDLVEEPIQYQYYASFWAKLPMPLLGVHVIKLVKAESNEDAQATGDRGLKIIAVIYESPAAKAGVVKGDNLLKVGDVALAKADDLFAAVKRYAGQTVEVEFLHNGTLTKTTVALNQR
ncbi:MAG: hypothetical protein RLZZ379_137 [Pseudomonadota bacterium]|jgi:hypothetical protein